MLGNLAQREWMTVVLGSIRILGNLAQKCQPALLGESGC